MGVDRCVLCAAGPWCDNTKRENTESVKDAFYASVPMDER